MIIDPDMPDHWKVRMLCDLIDDELGPVYLIRLWGHCQNRKKDVFDRLPPAAVKAICRFSGDPELLDNALSECGFIARENSGEVEVIGWSEHNANLWSAWKNGSRGGRPKKPTKNPPDNPQKTGGLTDEGDEGDEKKHTSAKPRSDCPEKEILDLYHEVLPELPCVRKFTDKRRRALRARWEDSKDMKHDAETGLEWWRRFFEYMRNSQFLMGETTSFIATFDFITTQSSFLKIYEGTYHNNRGIA